MEPGSFAKVIHMPTHPSSLAMLRPRPGVERISPYIPSQMIEMADQVGLASNESPHKPSKLVLDALQQVGDVTRLYPDATAYRLRTAIGQRYGLNPKQILCGAGSDEVISLLIRTYAGPGDEVLFPRHAFITARICTLGAGAEPIDVPERDLCTDVDALLNRVSEKTKIVYLANPNNPTGSWVSRGELRRLHENLPERVLLIIDSAYAEFLPTGAGDGSYDSGIECVDRGENTVMTRTFSKIYGLAALRVGWVYGPTNVIDMCHRVRSPFNLSAPAQLAATVAVADQHHIERLCAEIIATRTAFLDRLCQLRLEFVDPSANFVLVRFPVDDGQGLNSVYAAAWAAKHGFLLRSVEVYDLPEYLRITIGTADQMTRLGDIIAEFLQATPAERRDSVS